MLIADCLWLDAFQMKGEGAVIATVVVKAHKKPALRLPVEEFFYPKDDRSDDSKKEGEQDGGSTKSKKEQEEQEKLREELLQEQKKKRDQRDLFLRAFLRMTHKDPDDPYSFYQIAGIHGLPYTDYDKVPSAESGGYCTHGSPLFPVWHRVYLQLFEQALIKAAEEVVTEAFKEGSRELKRGKKLAASLRIPYWDWASPRNTETGVPSIFLEHTVKVAYPKEEEETVPNPLRSYVVQKETLRMDAVYGEQNMPTAREFVPAESAPPPLYKLYPTIR